MLVIPEEIKEKFRADNRTGDTARTVRLRFYDEEIQLLFPEETLFPDDELFPIDQDPIYVIDNFQISNETLAITESLCDSQDITFGSCDSAQFEITVADVLLDLTGKEFMATVEIAGYEMALGIYTVDSFIRQADRRLKKITAYDRMQKFNTDVAEWYTGLTFPMTLKQFRDSLCEHVGITQIDTTLPLDDMEVTETIEPEQLSGWDVLKAVCEINGCFGHIDKTGRLTYAFLPKAGLFPAETLFPDDELFPADMANYDNTETLSYYNQSQTSYEDYVVAPIERVQIRQEEGDVGAIYGDGSNTYVIQGNFLVYGKSADELLSIAMAAHEQISSRTYKPCKIVGPALPWVEVGDGLVCYTSDDVIETYCLKRTIKGVQRMIDTYTVKGSIKLEENFGIQAQIIQLAGKAAVIKKSVEEVSVRVEDLKEYTESQVSILANQITAEVKRATEAEAKLSIRADEITLSVKNLKEFTESQISVLADRILMKVSKGEVSSQLSIEPDQITLKSNRLSWTSTYSSMTSDGILTCKGIKAVDGTFTGTLETDVFYAGDDEVIFGDFTVTADGTNVFKSSDNSIVFQTREGGPLGSYPTLQISRGSGTPSVITDHHMESLTGYFGEVYITGDSWWEGWSLTKTMKDVYSKISKLQNQIDDI